MKSRNKAIAAAAVGTTAGLAGLSVLAIPAGADEAPALPPVSAESLVQSVFEAKAPAFDGTAQIENNLGLPAIPGMDQLNADSAKVIHGGDGKSRVSLRQGTSEKTLVHGPEQVWTYDSAKNSATKFTVGPEAASRHGAEHAKPGGDAMVDPARAATDLLATMRQSSTVSVDGTARVADRPAYELVLTPKPTERTVLREVRVAVDSATKLPLRMAVQTNGTQQPALRVGFSDITFAKQRPELFEFSPPEGAKVTEHPKPGGERHPASRGEDKPMKLVGDGWDTVVTAPMPADALATKAPAGDKRGQQVDPKALLERYSKPVTGAFGTGHVFSTKVGSALITDDGRFAAGAVPEQVLVEALGTK